MPGLFLINILTVPNVGSPIHKRIITGVSEILQPEAMKICFMQGLYCQAAGKNGNKTYINLQSLLTGRIIF